MLLLSITLPIAGGVVAPSASGDLGALGSTSDAPATLSCVAGMEVIGALLRGTKIGLSIFMAPQCTVATAFQWVSFRFVLFRECVAVRSSVRLSFLRLSRKAN